MKCLKCGYISFDNAERCRHCGFDFALGGEATESGAPLASPRRQAADVPPELRSFPAANVLQMRDVGHAAPTDDELPLFDRPIAGVDDTPLAVAPSAARTPLSVRRSAVESPRERPMELAPDWDRQVEHHVGRLHDRTPTPDAGLPELRASGARPPSLATADEGVARVSIVARLGAAVIDAFVIIGVDAAVVFLTLRLIERDVSQLTDLPALPMVAFFLLLNGGYFVGFITASGQTIGKMVTRVRVVSESAVKVSLGAAILRAAGILVTLLSLGVGYLPTLIGRERRALHDRLAGTRVVSIK